MSCLRNFSGLPPPYCLDFRQAPNRSIGVGTNDHRDLSLHRPPLPSNILCFLIQKIYHPRKLTDFSNETSSHYSCSILCWYSICMFLYLYDHHDWFKDGSDNFKLFNNVSGQHFTDVQIARSLFGCCAVAEDVDHRNITGPACF
jgi:hypothetical protein